MCGYLGQHRKLYIVFKKQKMILMTFPLHSTDSALFSGNTDKKYS